VKTKLNFAATDRESRPKRTDSRLIGSDMGIFTAQRRHGVYLSSIPLHTTFILSTPILHCCLTNQWHMLGPLPSNTLKRVFHYWFA